MPEYGKFFHSNVVGTALLFEVIRERCVPVQKVVIASSQSVYGEGQYSCSTHGLLLLEPRSSDDLARGDLGPAMPGVPGRFGTRPAAREPHESRQPLRSIEIRAGAGCAASRRASSGFQRSCWYSPVKRSNEQSVAKTFRHSSYLPAFVGIPGNPWNSNANRDSNLDACNLPQISDDHFRAHRKLVWTILTMCAIMVHMQERPRFYKALLADHLERHRQMALVSGPRQVGKTTTCRSVSDQYLNWDNADDRRLLLRGPAALAEALQLERLRAQPPVTTLDELHKYTKWKGLLKGFFDSYGDRVHLIVTGSSRIDVFRRGSDSMMGRYFLYHMNPWSVGESLRNRLATTRNSDA